MAEEPNQAVGDVAQITGQVMLYRQPEPLSAGQHGGLGIKREGDHLDFLRGAHFVPVVASEFAACSHHFPIIFSGEQHTPLAVMGLREGENVFVREDGAYEPHTYAPSYIRRYPFVLALQENGAGVVCIDRAHKAISDNPDLPFFENGEPSQFTREAVDFLRAFEDHRKATEAMVAELRELDLFENKICRYTPAGAQPGGDQDVPVAQYVGIGEQKLAALPADKLKGLQEKGFLPLIYAHLISLNNWSHIVNRSIARGFVPASPEGMAQAIAARNAPQTTN